MNHPRIEGIGTENPPLRLTQEESFHAEGPTGSRQIAAIRKLSISRLSSTPGWSRRLDFNIAMGSCAWYWEPRFDTCRPQD